MIPAPGTHTSPATLGRDRPETSGELAERLVPVAIDLVMRVHDEGRDSIGQLLTALTTAERWALLVVLAAMVPPDAPTADLLGWVTWDDDTRPGTANPPIPPASAAVGRMLRPCGTHAAYVRHKAHGEPPCAECIGAERAYQRARPGRPAA